MDERRFDQRLRDKLQRHREAVPGRVWDKVAAGAEGRRRGAGWWKASGLLLLLFSGLGYLGYEFSRTPGPPVAQAPGSEARERHAAAAQAGGPANISAGTTARATVPPDAQAAAMQARPNPAAVAKAGPVDNH